MCLEGFGLICSLGAFDVTNIIVKVFEKPLGLITYLNFSLEMESSYASTFVFRIGLGLCQTAFHLVTMLLLSRN